MIQVVLQRWRGNMPGSVVSPSVELSVMVCYMVWGGTVVVLPHGISQHD